MINYAVVGTGPISRQFVEAAHAQGDWRLRGVLGSSHERGRDFSASLPFQDDGTVVYRDSDELAGSGDVDVVYVATPNSLHARMAERMASHHKHVIVEKPAFSNSAEWVRVCHAADAGGVLMLEAARHLYEPNYQALRGAVAGLGEISGASLVFRQYSSRYPSYLAGGRPRILTAEFSGGAMADLGVYQLYAVVDWFGMPREARYYARILDTGADAGGHAVLRYSGFDVTLAVSKTQASHQPCEVYGSHGEVLAFNNVAGIAWVTLSRDARGHAVALDGVGPVATNPLAHEVEHLSRRLEAFPDEPDRAPYSYERLRMLGADVATLSERLRHSAGVVFPADSVTVDS
ncbi:MAG TPA: Gfo/Idh/MocA family oxidoreductase [Pseudonocardiaceae bacterium]